MKLVIQKSGPASVEIDGKLCAAIDSGLVVLLGVTVADTEKDVDYLVDKLVNMRLFESGEKHFDQSVLDLGKPILLVSQFTLYAECRKGRRPDFANSAKADEAAPLYELFTKKLRALGVHVETGVFGAMMKVNLINEGPVTIILES